MSQIAKEETRENHVMLRERKSEGVIFVFGPSIHISSFTCDDDPLLFCLSNYLLHIFYHHSFLSTNKKEEESFFKKKKNKKEEDFL